MTVPSEPTEPPVSADVQLYNTARKGIDEASTLQVLASREQTAAVGGESFTLNSTQTIQLSGIGTDAFQAQVAETQRVGDVTCQYKDLIAEYNKAMMFDRNELMLKKAEEYLASGKTVFFAVGLSHLLDDTNGLVAALRDTGYTVELATYG